MLRIPRASRVAQIVARDLRSGWLIKLKSSKRRKSYNSALMIDGVTTSSLPEIESVEWSWIESLDLSRLRPEDGNDHAWQ